MNRKPKITIAIVCLNEEKNIGLCLNSVFGQSYGAENFDVLVIDNGSDDKTVSIVESLQNKRKNLALIVNKKRGIANSRNLALKKMKTPMGAFVDADCLLDRSWLSLLVEAYFEWKKEDSQIIIAGGSNKVPMGRFYKAFEIMTGSILGSHGSVQTKRRENSQLVGHIPTMNMLFDVKAILGIGGFDPSFFPSGEDEDMTFRAGKRGYHLLYVPKASVAHKISSGYLDWTKKSFGYGIGRMKLMRKHSGIIHLYFVMPIVFVVTLPVSLPFYIPVMLIYSFWLSNKAKRADLAGGVFFLFLATHLSYGAGEVWEFFKGKDKC